MELPSFHIRASDRPPTPPPLRLSFDEEMDVEREWYIEGKKHADSRRGKGKWGILFVKEKGRMEEEEGTEAMLENGESPTLPRRDNDTPSMTTTALQTQEAATQTTELHPPPPRASLRPLYADLDVSASNSASASSSTLDRASASTSVNALFGLKPEGRSAVKPASEARLPVYLPFGPAGPYLTENIQSSIGVGGEEPGREQAKVKVVGRSFERTNKSRTLREEERRRKDKGKERERANDWFISRAISAKQPSSPADSSSELAAVPASRPASTSAPSERTTCEVCGLVLPYPVTPVTLREHNRSMVHRLAADDRTMSASAPVSPRPSRSAAAPSTSRPPPQTAPSSPPPAKDPLEREKQHLPRKRRKESDEDAEDRETDELRFRALGPENRGYGLLARMGWVKGMGLGTSAHSSVGSPSTRSSATGKGQEGEKGETEVEDSDEEVDYADEWKGISYDSHSDSVEVVDGGGGDGRAGGGREVASENQHMSDIRPDDASAVAVATRGEATEVVDLTIDSEPGDDDNGGQRHVGLGARRLWRKNVTLASSSVSRREEEEPEPEGPCPRRDKLCGGTPPTLAGCGDEGARSAHGREEDEGRHPTPTRSRSRSPPRLVPVSVRVKNDRYGLGHSRPRPKSSSANEGNPEAGSGSEGKGKGKGKGKSKVSGLARTTESGRSRLELSETERRRERERVRDERLMGEKRRERERRMRQEKREFMGLLAYMNS